MDEFLRPTMPNADAPRPRLVPRVYAPRPGTEFAVQKFRLKKCLEREDTDGALAVARTMTKSEYRTAIDEIVAEDEIRKSAAMPADESREVPAGPTKTNWASAFRLPRWGGRPAQPQAPPALAPIIAIGSGPVRRTFKPQRGSLVHFQSGDAILTGKVLDWGSSGALVVTRDGEFTVSWEVLGDGPAPGTLGEQRHLLAKSQWAARDRVQADTITMLTLSPEDRAAWWARRHGEDLP